MYVHMYIISVLNTVTMKPCVMRKVWACSPSGFCSRFIWRFNSSILSLYSNLLWFLNKYFLNACSWWKRFAYFSFCQCWVQNFILSETYFWCASCSKNKTTTRPEEIKQISEFHKWRHVGLHQFRKGTAEMN